MAAYRRVCDSRHLQADCQEPGSAPNPTLGNRVWATFITFGRRNESAPIQLAQCRFSGLAISNAKVLINIFRYPRVHGRNFFKQHSETVMD